MANNTLKKTILDEKKIIIYDFPPVRVYNYLKKYCIQLTQFKYL